jgi:hypothetical protein
MHGIKIITVFSIKLFVIAFTSVKKRRKGRILQNMNKRKGWEMGKLLVGCVEWRA